MAETKGTILMPFTRSLRWRIASWMLLIGLLPTVIIGAIAYGRLADSAETAGNGLRDSQTQLEEDVVGARLSHTTMDIATEIDRYMLERMSDALSWASAPVVLETAKKGWLTAENEGLPSMTIDEQEATYSITHSLGTNAVADDYLKHQVELSPHFGEVFFTDAHGFNVALSELTSDFVQSDEDWWRGAWENRIHVGEVEYDESAGIWSVDISMRITDPQTQEAVGVMKSVLGVSLLQEIVDRHVDIAGYGTITVLTSEGLILAETASDHDPARVMNRAVNLRDSDLAVVDLAFTTENAAGYDLADEMVSGYARSGGASFYETIAGFDGFGWAVIVQQPREVATASLAPLVALEGQLRASRQAVGLTVLGVTLAVAMAASILALFLSRRITIPITQLRDAADKVSIGDANVEIKVDSQDEIGDMATSFNRMVIARKQVEDELRRHRDHLEDMVQHRTAELTTANEHLRNEVSERKRAEDEKRVMERQLQLAGRLASVGELAAGVAHELNNPIAIVQMYAELLRDRDHLDESMKSDVHTILSEAERASRITGNLLSFARKHKPEKALISINEVIEKTLELHEYRMKVNNIEVLTELAPDLPLTMADYHQMQQVFVNIVTNAEQVMTDANGKGKLSVSTRAAGEMVETAFTDDGPGIPEDNLEKVFDPFFTTKEVGKGTGLGLSICFGIVQAHGGRMYARRNPGEGTTFVVEIPIISEAQTSDGQTDATQDRGVKNGPS